MSLSKKKASTVVTVFTLISVAATTLLRLGRPMGQAGHSRKLESPLRYRRRQLRPTPEGGAVSLRFDKDNKMWALYNIARRLIKLDPRSGTVLEDIDLGAGLVPDDFVLAADGTIYWTDFVLGTVFELQPGANRAEKLFPFHSFPHANPILLGDNEKRLFFGQCFGLVNNRIFDYNFETGETRQVGRGSVPLCASNGFALRKNLLYATQTLAGRIVAIDVNDRTASPILISTQVHLPAYAQFDSKGHLFVAGGLGEIYRINLKNEDAGSNAEMVARVDGGLSCLAFDKSDRLFACPLLGGSNVEVDLDTGETRPITLSLS